MRSSKDRPGLIMAKMNSLVDTEIIDALYKVSQQNVQIKLNIRGICCLKPGVPGLSENIEVTSIVDMFLEHSRMLYFQNGGEDELFLSSADWMPRNLDRRIELMFPIEDKESKRSLIEILKLYFKDNVKSWQLGPDGRYKKVDADSKKRFRVQEYLCKKAAEEEALAEKSFHMEKDLKPQKPIHSRN
jgi:polyphosphate kinase